MLRRQRRISFVRAIWGLPPRFTFRRPVYTVPQVPRTIHTRYRSVVNRRLARRREPGHSDRRLRPLCRGLDRSKFRLTTLVTMVAQLTIPDDLKPRDGRFGPGPSQVRPEQLAVLSAS